MVKPTDLATLVAHLMLSPLVIVTPPQGPSEERTFTGYANGRLHWSTVDGDKFTPVTQEGACGGSKPLLTFKESGFYVHAFGNDWWFSYLE